MTIYIKQATAEDIPVIRDICLKVWPITYTPIIGEQQVKYMLNLFYSQESLERQMLEAGHKFLLCYSDRVPAAYASYAQTEPGIFKLHKLYISPDYQGKGLGRLLVFQIIEEVKALGARALRLNVNRYNYSALAFYGKTGFRLLSEEDIDIGGGFFMNDFVLSREIALSDDEMEPGAN